MHGARSWIPALIQVCVGLSLIVLGALFSPPVEWVPLLLVGIGLLVATAPFLQKVAKGIGLSANLFIRARIDSAEQSILQRIDSAEHTIVGRMDWQWVLHRGDNWKTARKLIELAEKAGVECYDTSSHDNQNAYEEHVRRLAQYWRDRAYADRRFTRVFCFSDTSNEKQDRGCMTLFHQILDPTRDPAGHYDSLRACIIAGQMRVLHLPFRLLTDYLLVRTVDAHECLFSLAPPEGTPFLASARVRDADAGDMLRSHVQHIVHLAINHCREIACRYDARFAASFYEFDKDRNTLLPSAKGHSGE